MGERPTKRQLDALEWAEWGADNFGGGYFTSRSATKKCAEQCVARGWLERRRLVACDDDCHALEPERWRNGYALTEAGRQCLAAERRAKGGAA